MIKWWLIEFDGDRAGTFGYLRWEGEEAKIYDDAGNEVIVCDYHTVTQNVDPPTWA